MSNQFLLKKFFPVFFFNGKSLYDGECGRLNFFFFFKGIDFKKNFAFKLFIAIVFLFFFNYREIILSHPGLLIVLFLKKNLWNGTIVQKFEKEKEESSLVSFSGLDIAFFFS